MLWSKNGQKHDLVFRGARVVDPTEEVDAVCDVRVDGGTIADVLAYCARAQKDLDAITHAEERIARLEADANGLRKQLARLGEALSEKRRQAAQATRRRNQPRGGALGPG